MRPGDDVIERLRAEHGEIYQLEAAGEAVIARPPTRAEYRRFRAKVLDEKGREAALETLTRACVVWPDTSAFDALLERKPALAEVFGAKLLELAGAVEEAELKKL